MQFDSVSSSGKTPIETKTGSIRDRQPGKGRPSLMFTGALRRLAQHYENGSAKYGDRNWEKGQPLSWYYDSAQRHLWAILEKDTQENHYAAVMWNIAAMIHHIDEIIAGRLPRELDDLGIIQQKVDGVSPDIINPPAIITPESYTTLSSQDKQQYYFDVYP